MKRLATTAGPRPTTVASRPATASRVAGRLKENASTPTPSPERAGHSAYRMARNNAAVAGRES
jgi:hypothetical protein